MNKEMPRDIGLWIALGCYIVNAVIGGIIGSCFAIVGIILLLIGFIYTVRDSFKRVPGVWRGWVLSLATITVMIIGSSLHN